MSGRLLIPVLVLGMWAVPCLAQSDNATAPVDSNPAPTPASASASPSTPKKVWTNDDIAKDKKGVSVVGDKVNKNYHMSPDKPADPATVARIRKDLEKLQAQLDDIDSKVKSYKEFQQGEAVSTAARDLSKGVNRVPVDQQLVQLQEKKKQLQAQIGDLYDEARKKGIDPGQLR